MALVILPAFVPILAPLLALANDAAPAASSPWPGSATSPFSVLAAAYDVSPVSQFIITGISVTNETVDMRSSQKKNELKYPSLPIEAKSNSIKNRTNDTDVKATKILSVF